jgi:hypothetical protein
MWIDYQVPVGLVGEITRYDGSCLVDRTAGEAGARCDSEAANTITLNLMHEIVTGKRTVEEAREVYAENMAGYTMGRPGAVRRAAAVPRPAGRHRGPGYGHGRVAGAQAGGREGEGRAHRARARADGPQDVTGGR